MRVLCPAIYLYSSYCFILCMIILLLQCDCHRRMRMKKMDEDKYKRDLIKAKKKTPKNRQA